MRNRIFAVFALAILAGGGLAYATYNFMQNQPVKSVSTPTQPVVVAAADLQLGTELKKDDLQVINFPKGQAPEGTFSQVEQLLGLPLHNGYGMTESSPVVCSNTFEDNVPSSVGRPIPGVEVKLGENDALLIHGPNVMLGYWKDPEATQAVITPDRWLNSGDIARIDETGRILHTGRADLGERERGVVLVRVFLVPALQPVGEERRRAAHLGAAHGGSQSTGHDLAQHRREDVLEQALREIGIVVDWATNGNAYRAELFFCGTREYPGHRFGGRIDEVEEPLDEGLPPRGNAGSRAASDPRKESEPDESEDEERRVHVTLTAAGRKLKAQARKIPVVVDLDAGIHAAGLRRGAGRCVGVTRGAVFLLG